MNERQLPTRRTEVLYVWSEGDNFHPAVSVVDTAIQTDQQVTHFVKIMFWEVVQF